MPDRAIQQGGYSREHLESHPGNRFGIAFDGLATVFAQAGGRYGDGWLMGPGIYHFWGMGFFNLAVWILSY